MPKWEGSKLDKISTSKSLTRTNTLVRRFCFECETLRNSTLTFSVRKRMGNASTILTVIILSNAIFKK